MFATIRKYEGVGDIHATELTAKEQFFSAFREAARVHLAYRRQHGRQYGHVADNLQDTGAGRSW